tara:strand:+ start:445 stop:1584 length:1140 start_codon:yes stop_codon:yes gene_type:complete
MIKSIFAESDNTIYEKTGSLNAGTDSILELSKVSSSTGIFNSRILLNFNLDHISASIAGGDISKSLSTPKFYLNLYQTETNEVPLEYKLIAYPISQSWSPGEGRRVDPISLNLFDRLGSSWIYRNKTSPTTNDVPARDIKWTSNVASGSVMLFSSVTGGGTWHASHYGTQSFNHESADIRMDVTPVINKILSTMGADGKYVNDGIILLRSGSQETNATKYGRNAFFSRETNTVYQPRLEVVYDDSNFISGSLSELNSEQSVVYLKNLKHEYNRKEIPKIRIIGRDRYPTKTFATSSNFKTIKYLPTSSYYAVRDAITDEFVVPYSSFGTKLSCDSNGNYIKLEMNSFMPERYYKMCFQVTQSDSSVVVYDENFYFKVNR